MTFLIFVYNFANFFQQLLRYHRAQNVSSYSRHFSIFFLYLKGSISDRINNSYTPILQMAKVPSQLSSCPRIRPRSCLACPILLWVDGVYKKCRPFCKAFVPQQIAGSNNLCSFLQNSVWLGLKHFLCSPMQMNCTHQPTLTAALRGSVREQVKLYERRQLGREHFGHPHELFIHGFTLCLRTSRDTRPYSSELMYFMALGGVFFLSPSKALLVRKVLSF